MISTFIVTHTCPCLQCHQIMRLQRLMPGSKPTGCILFPGTLSRYPRDVKLYARCHMYWITCQCDYHHLACPDQLTAAEKSVPALTTMGRTEWWTVRRDHFSHGVNRDSLSSVESAILFVSCHHLLISLPYSYSVSMVAVVLLFSLRPSATNPLRPSATDPLRPSATDPLR